MERQSQKPKEKEKEQDKAIGKETYNPCDIFRHMGYSIFYPFWVENILVSLREFLSS